MVLGNSVFHGQRLTKRPRTAVSKGEGAAVFGYYVNDPERFGMMEFDRDDKAALIEEKSEEPKSNYCVTSFYFYNNRMMEYVKNSKSSAKGELEIANLNRIYLEKDKPNMILLG